MTDKQALNEIFENLKAGEKYGYLAFWNYYENQRLRYPYFSSVLYKTFSGNIGWNIHGSSAVKFTKTDLAWLLNTIFNTSARGFLENYITETQMRKVISGYDKLIEAN